MKITDVRTTQLRVPDLPGIQDATIRHPDTGRGGLFIHIDTDAGLTGFGIGSGSGTRAASRSRVMARS